MSSVLSPATGGELANSDPFNWNVDQVVRALCHQEGEVFSLDESLLLPEPEKLETILRENEMNGRALLSIKDQSEIRDDLGIRAFGHRVNLMHLIERLQHLSTRYRQQIERQIIFKNSLSEPYTASRLGTPIFQPALSHGSISVAPSAIQSLGDSLVNTSHIEILGKRAAAEPEDELSKATELNQRPNETHVIDDQGRKRRRLVLGNENENTVSSSSMPLPPRPTNQSENQPANLNSVPAAPERDSELFADNTTTVLDENAAHVAAQNPPSEPQNEKVVSPERARKRVKPSLVLGLAPFADTEPEASEFTSSALLSSRANEDSHLKNSKRFNRRNRDNYLGISAISVDSVFYGTTQMGKQLEKARSSEDEEFSLHWKPTISGQQQYVGSRMKYFLQCQSQDLPTKTGLRKILRPYPDYLGKKHRPLSATMFFHESNKVVALRVNRHEWLAQRHERTMSEGVDESTVQINNVAEPEMAVGNDTDRDWRSLEKWDYLSDNTVLPLYGDSGSEGEYDLETWKDIEEEGGRIEKPEGPSRSSRLLQTLIEATLDEAVVQMKERWHVFKRPKMERKAWRIWTRARKDHTTEVEVQRLRERSTVLETRLLKLRKEIVGEHWSKTKELVRQSRIMEPTLYDIEECSFKMGILLSKKAPAKTSQPKATERPTRRQSPSLQPLKEDEEDIQSVASSVDGSISDGSLDDFIVEDEEDGQEALQIADQDETTMADVEDGVDSEATAVELEEDQSQAEPHKITPESKSGGAELTQSAELSDSSPSSIRAVILPELTPKIEKGDSPKSRDARLGEGDAPLVSQESENKTSRSQKPKSVNSKALITPGVEIILLSSDSESQPKRSSPATLPLLSDITAVTKLKFAELVERKDRKRLLLWLMGRVPENDRLNAFAYCKQIPMESCHADVVKGLNVLLHNGSSIPGMDKDFSASALQVTSWFISWTNLVKPLSRGFRASNIETTIEKGYGFDDFFGFLLECVEYFKNRSMQNRGSLVTPRKPKKGVFVSDESESGSDSPESLKGGRNTFSTESQQTLAKRDIAMRRVQETEQRKKQLQNGMPRIAAQSDGQASIVVNPGKLDHHDFINLPSDFGNGAYLKSHQVEGLRFMWREITGDPSDLQGCLLAQTMGLGKTVQVIALLVTIAEAAASTNENILDQLPVSLRKSQTLVLCPPSLVENWWDEFLMWPHPANHLGQIRKVTSVMPLTERLDEISAWSEEGGVLILGTSTFRDFVQNSTRSYKRSDGKPRATLTHDQHQMVTRAFLERPNIVILDEAHEVKNPDAKIHKAVNQIKCKSRIAMTGSPLANNLSEYFSLINWIAPGYLGSPSEFKETYEKPITAGLYQESTQGEYRESRKRLKALELELEPKVHRADVSALHSSLHGKMEFVIKVPLTRLQHGLYCDYVDNVRHLAPNDDAPAQTLWSWMGALQLLCNHPKSYYDQLLKNFQTPTAGVKASSSSDEGELAVTTFNSSHQNASNLFDQQLEKSDSPVHSNKMQILFRILELSETANDKVLVFSHRIATLHYIRQQLKKLGRECSSITGEDGVVHRQTITKEFNEGIKSVCLISTRAGGQGLNLYSANRVVILDESFNPMWEQQAVGRAYRIGQKKQVYVYRLTAAGTFEEQIQAQSRFKEQLATRVVDKKNPARSVSKKSSNYLYHPKEVTQEDLSSFQGKDHQVLDHLLDRDQSCPMLSITHFETFYVDDGQELTDQERQEAIDLQRDEQLRRRDPAKYHALMESRRAAAFHPQMRPTLSGWPASSLPVPLSAQYGQPPRHPLFPLSPINSMNGHLSNGIPSSAPPTSQVVMQHSQAAIAQQTPASIQPDTAKSIGTSFLEPVAALNTKTRPALPEKEHRNKGDSEASQHSAAQQNENGLHPRMAPDTALFPKPSPNLEGAATQSQIKTPTKPTVKPNLEGKDLNAAVQEIFRFVRHGTFATSFREPIHRPLREEVESEFRDILSKRRPSLNSLFRDESDGIIKRLKVLLSYVAQTPDEYRRISLGIQVLLKRDDTEPKDVVSRLYDHEVVAGHNMLSSTSSPKRPHTSSPLNQPSPLLKRHKSANIPSPHFKSTGDTENRFENFLQDERNGRRS